jgi:hypothetical protein
MAQLTRGIRLQIMLTGDEWKAIDDWRFRRHLPSRASAVRELLRRGLADGRAPNTGVVDRPRAISPDRRSGKKKPRR